MFVLGLLIPFSGIGQQYSLDWHAVSGGAGTSAGGPFVVSGTLGQYDAAGQLAGGSFSLTGGFWSLMGLNETGCAPQLLIERTGNLLTVYWLATPGWSLQQTLNLAAPVAWAPSTGVTTSDGTNTLVITPAPGNQFYRLIKP